MAKHTFLPRLYRLPVWEVGGVQLCVDSRNLELMGSIFSMEFIPKNQVIFRISIPTSSQSLWVLVTLVEGESQVLIVEEPCRALLGMRR